jgi:hypothetical protein
MRVVASGTHCHVIAFFNLLDQAMNIIGVMLPVGIHEYDDVPGRRPRSGLDGCPIAHAVAVANDTRAGSFGNHAVSSVDPSSTTSTSALGSCRRMSSITDFMAPDSFLAGMTAEMLK